MPALDKILDSMKPSGADLLVLKAGEVPMLQGQGGGRPVHKQPLSEAHVLSYINELAGEAEKKSLAAKQETEFSYRDFQVNVAFAGGSVSARIRPAGGDAGSEGGIEIRNAIDKLFYKMIADGAYWTLGGMDGDRDVIGDLVRIEMPVQTEQQTVNE